MNDHILFLQTLAAIIARSVRLRTAFGRFALVMAALLAMGLSSPAARAQTVHILHNFDGDSDGAYGYGGLTNVNGVLYGTTSGGYFQAGGNAHSGANTNPIKGYGVVFSVNPDGTNFQPVYTFQDGIDGAFPYGRLILVNGFLYGTTLYGGANGEGTVFIINPATHQEFTLYSFRGGTTDGAHPTAGLLNVNGTLYGTTLAGGGSGNGGTGDGTVFAIQTDGTGYQVLHSFTGTNGDGAVPWASLIAVNGILYGTASQGGNNNNGTVFSVNPSTKVETTLHQFTGTNGEGSEPFADLILVNGTLYGNTYQGGAHSNGTLFTISTNGTGFQTLYSFSTADGVAQFPVLGRNGDGAYPVGGYTLVNGLLYGTTSAGGARGVGTAFSLDPTTHVETTLLSFNGANDPPAAHTPPGCPTDDLLNVNGVLYGTTYSGAGGLELGWGSLFALTLTNLAPVAASDTYAPQYETPYAVSAAKGVLANDNTRGNGTLTAALVSSPVHGTVTLNTDGSFLYTPATGFLGTDSFTYQAANFGGTSNIATVTLNVHAAPPVAHTDTYTVSYNTALTISAPGVLADDYPGSPGTVTAALVSNPSHGTLTFHSDGSFTYTPSAGYVGTDSFTYNATNALGTSNTAPVNLTILPPLPLAADDSYAPQYQTAYSVHAPGVLANDNSRGNGTLTAVLVTTTSHGSLTFNSDGSFTYTPNTGFAGTDSFTYQASSAAGNSNTATVSLHVQASPPTAHNDAYAPRYEIAFAVKAPGVLANDANNDTGTLTAVLVSGPAHGTLTFNSDGSFTYTSSAGFSGTDTFTYQAVNSAGTSAVATVSLVIQTSSPIAAGDAYTVAHNTTFAVHAPGVQANDYAGAPALISILASQPNHGTLTFNSDGSFTYVPNAGYSGPDSFIYYDDNSVGISNTATVALTVQ